MGVHEARGQLARSLKDLMARWQDVRTTWTDARAQEFEKRIIDALHMDLRNAGGAMDHIAQILSAARRDCE